MRRNKNKVKRSITVAIVYHRIPAYFSSRSIRQKRLFVDGDTKSIIQSITRGLRMNGFRTITIGITEDDISPLQNLRADYVFNLVDSRKMELKVAKILERLGVPHSGSYTDGLRTSNNKIRSKRIFERTDIQTPAYSVYVPGQSLTTLTKPAPFPLIVKPAFDHCSIGISHMSIVHSMKELKKRVRFLARQLRQPLLIERFIPGREVHILVAEHRNGITAFPPAEMKFAKAIHRKWNIYGFPEKWSEASFAYRQLYFEAPVTGIPRLILRKMKRDAQRAFYALGYRDYARFDFRYNPKTRMHFLLEGNANAGMSTDSGDAFMASLKAAGIPFFRFLRALIENSIPGLAVKNPREHRFSFL